MLLALLRARGIVLMAQVYASIRVKGKPEGGGRSVTAVTCGEIVMSGWRHILLICVYTSP